MVATAVGCLSALLGPSPARAATAESARTAVWDAFGETLTMNQAEALIAVLVCLEDGGTLAVGIDELRARFEIRGETVVRVEGASETAPAQAYPPRSAVALSLGAPVDLAGLRAQLQRQGGDIGRLAGGLLTFCPPGSGYAATVSANGAMVVCGPQPLDSLAAVDELDREALALARSIDLGDDAVRGPQLYLAWLRRQYYSDPPGTYHLAVFSTGAASYGRGVQEAPRDFEASIDLTDGPARAARLTVLAPGAGAQALSGLLALDGQLLTACDAAELPYPIAMQRLSADLPGCLHPGRSVLSAAPRRAAEGSLPPCDLELSLITPPDPGGRLHVAVRGQVVTGRASRPLSELTEEWKGVELPALPAVSTAAPERSIETRTPPAW